MGDSLLHYLNCTEQWLIQTAHFRTDRLIFPCTQQIKESAIFSPCVFRIPNFMLYFHGKSTVQVLPVLCMLWAEESETSRSLSKLVRNKYLKTSGLLISFYTSPRTNSVIHLHPLAYKAIALSYKEPHIIFLINWR